MTELLPPPDAGARAVPMRPEHLATQLEKLLEREPHARAVGVHATAPWAGVDAITLGGAAHPVVWCPSELSIREALDRHEQEGDAPALVLLTPVQADDLGWDVRVRLARRRLVDPAPWDVVRDLFRTRDIDGRITPHRWMADALLQVPAGGYAPATGGILDADTAWEHVLRQLLGLSTGRPTAEALLAWSAGPGAAARYERLSPDARDGVRGRLHESAGALAGPMAAALDAGRGGWLMALGLACEVLFPGGARAAGELAGAAIRLERYLGDRVLDPALAGAWARAAARTVDRLTEPQAAAAFAQAEEVLREVGADGSVGLSTVLPAAYQRRLERFGRALHAHAEGRGALAEVERAFAEVQAHREAGRAAQAERVERLRMAVRLARRLEAGARPAPRSLAEAARAYTADGGWVDWARSLVLGGDGNGTVAAALDALSGRARTLREAENQAFARALAEWTRSPGGDVAVLPIERVLDEVAAPAAAQGSLLFLVLDGMSWAAFLQLAAELRGRGWEQWSAAAPGTVLATVPCVTQVSRATLFAGRVSGGTGADEKRAFAQHRALPASSRARKPLLFHKGELVEGTSATLAEEVRAALRDPEQKVVGVVLNVLDDWLARSDQVSPRWTVDRIRLLEALLYEAQIAGRVVVLASDHGHVLEADTRQIPGGEQERWRPFAEPLAAEEVAVSGRRVQDALGAPAVVVPWSEAVRYGRRKAGYHGGATPQEMLVPVSTWAPWDRELAGWQVVRDEPPAWWEPALVPEAAAPPAPVPDPAPRRRARADDGAQPSLFAEVPAAAGGDWIAALLASPVYTAQRALAGRLAPDHALVRAFLQLSERYGGRVPRSALAAALGQPEIRVRGLLAVLQRLLNVDGYPVVAVDDAEIVVVQRELLRRQFQLDGAG